MDILSLLEPGYCYYCGCPCLRPEGICPSCAESVLSQIAVKGRRCTRCSMPRGDSACAFCEALPGDLAGLFSLGYFEGLLKELLSAYKGNRFPGARFLFAAWLHREFQNKGWHRYPVVPVPPRKGKIRKSGWDQVDLIAAILKRKYRMDVLKCLRRNDRLQQKTLSFDKRMDHMENNLSFVGYPESILPGRRPPEYAELSALTERDDPEGKGIGESRPAGIILLDDVFTSGATLAASARLLRRRTGLPVYGAVICRVI